MPPEQGGLKWRRLLLPLAAAAIVAGLSWLDRRSPAPAVIAAPVPIAPQYKGYDAARVLADIDLEIRERNERIASGLGDMLDQQALAGAWLSRSKLTGSLDEIAKAIEATDAGIALSVPGAGPWLARAAATFTAHRLSDSEASLERVDKFVIADYATRAEARATRGDIAMARGDFVRAARLFGEAGELDRWPGLLYRQSLLARVTGDYESARRLLHEADALNRFPQPLFRADLELRLGEIDYAQGKWEGARDHFAKADAQLPGYWRAQMRVAQMQALSGQESAALDAFERIANLNENPDAMYIAAGMRKDRGDRQAASQWITRAGNAWETRLNVLPEAAWGHAAEHELTFGDPRKALLYAGRNARARPAGLPLLVLAEAWLANGRPDYALALCLKVEASGWVSSDQWVLRARVLNLLGRNDEAEDARNSALKLNPHALDPIPALAWFHD